MRFNSLSREELLNYIHRLSDERNKRMKSDLIVSHVNKYLEAENIRMHNIQEFIGTALELHNVSEIFELTVETLIESFECENALFLLQESENNYKVVYDFSFTFETGYLNLNTNLDNNAHLLDNNNFFKNCNTLNNANGLIASVDDENLIIAYNSQENNNVFEALKTEHLASFQIIAKQISSILKNINGKIEIETLNKDLEEKVKERTKKLALLASTDPMTKLYNRRYFLDTSIIVLKSLKRDKKISSILMFDIDHFKNVNDTYGHNVGDNVIVSLAEKLKKFTRESDIVCRWGGEEFVILLLDTDVSSAIKVAEKIRADVESSVVKVDDEKILQFTISIGVSKVNEQSAIDFSIAKADEALYKAKETGRNKVCIN